MSRNSFRTRTATYPRLTPLGALLALIVVSMLIPTPAWPWCWIRDTGRYSCGSGLYNQECCSGNLRLWENDEMEYRISTYTGAGQLSAIRAAAEAWNGVEMARFEFYEGAPTDQWNAKNDGINLINIDGSFCQHFPNYCGMGVLGFSGTWTVGSGTAAYHAVESDVILNGEEFAWGDGSGSTVNTQAVVAHELGHSAGLSHPGNICRSGGSAGCGEEVPHATMYWNYSGGQPTDKASLELDDVAALVYGYPESSIRVQVLDETTGAPIQGANIELMETSAPVNGTDRMSGGSVWGDIDASLIGDGSPSDSYRQASPFYESDQSGYTNYISPLHSRFRIRVRAGNVSRVVDIEAPAGDTTQIVQLPLNACVSPPVRGEDGWFSSITEAYRESGPAGTIEALTAEFNESLYLDEAKTVYVSGGWDCNFEDSPGTSVINGQLVVSSGSVTIKGIVIR